jgi:hypothetical protein
MTVLHPKAFQRSPAAGFDGIFDWDFLKPAFEGTRIEPMDFDAVVERRGHFLCFETKEGFKPIPRGQELTLQSAVLAGNWTIIVLRAKRAADIEDWDVWYRGRAGGRLEKRHIEGNSDDLVEFVRRWFLKASEKAA